MIREGFNGDESFFVGTEVEHTPAFGLKTLFVVGVQDTTRIHIKYTQNQCEHIYFGANMSFPNPTSDNWKEWEPWEKMIKEILDLGILCTLDVDSTSSEGLLESGLTEHNNFIPMISVKLPYIHQLGYNATIKLDDKDFNATNPGVWCHSVHDLQKREVFTPWANYTKDTLL